MTYPLFIQFKSIRIHPFVTDCVPRKALSKIYKYKKLQKGEKQMRQLADDQKNAPKEE